MLDVKDFLPGDDEKINQLLRFTAEVDKMTAIKRRTMLIDGSRRENDAEHSWHIALMAMLFKDYAPEGCDVSRAACMCIVHDLVEIYAGDTFAYDDAANVGKEETICCVFNLQKRGFSCKISKINLISSITKMQKGDTTWKV